MGLGGIWQGRRGSVGVDGGWGGVLEILCCLETEFWEEVWEGVEG